MIVLVSGQTLVTARHGVDTTVTVQTCELAVAEFPHTSVPDTPKISVLGPQRVGVIVWVGSAALAPAGSELMLVTTSVLWVPSALVMVSVTTTLVIVAVPQLVTKPVTVYDGDERLTVATVGQILVTARHGVDTTVTVQTCELAVAGFPHRSAPVAWKASVLGPQRVGTMV